MRFKKHEYIDNKGSPPSATVSQMKIGTSGALRNMFEDFEQERKFEAKQHAEPNRLDNQKGKKKDNTLIFSVKKTLMIL